MTKRIKVAKNRCRIALLLQETSDQRLNESINLSMVAAFFFQLSGNEIGDIFITENKEIKLWNVEEVKP